MNRKIFDFNKLGYAEEKAEETHQHSVQKKAAPVDTKKTDRGKVGDDQICLAREKRRSQT